MIVNIIALLLLNSTQINFTYGKHCNFGFNPKIRNSRKNALTNSEIMQTLEVFNYGQVNLENVLAGLVLNSKNLYNDRSREVNEGILATDEVNELRKEIKRDYLKHYSLLRIDLSDEPVLLKTLEVTGRRHSNFLKWVQQAESFYSNILGNDVAKASLANYSVTDETLQNMQTKLSTIRDLKIKQSKEKGEAERATEAMYETADELNEWYSKFKKIARIAFNDKQQLLEVMGIFVES